MLFMLIALVFLLLAALTVPAIWRLHWGWLGMAFLVMGELWPALWALSQQNPPGR